MGDGRLVGVGKSEFEAVDVSASGDGFGCAAFLRVIVIFKCQLRLLVLWEPRLVVVVVTCGWFMN